MFGHCDPSDLVQIGATSAVILQLRPCTLMGVPFTGGAHIVLRGVPWLQPGAPLAARPSPPRPSPARELVTWVEPGFSQNRPPLNVLGRLGGRAFQRLGVFPVGGLGGLMEAYAMFHRRWM